MRVRLSLCCVGTCAIVEIFDNCYMNRLKGDVRQALGLREAPIVGGEVVSEARAEVTSM